MTILLKTAKEIHDKISKMDFYQNASADHFPNLSKQQKGRFISAMEQVYFSYNLFFSIFESLAHSLSSIESIKQWRNSFDLSNSTDYQESRKRNMELVLAWESIFFSLSKLYFNLRDNGLISEFDLIKHYPELNYVRLLRNDFMQHPDLFFPFHKSGRSFIYPGNSDLLPYEQISPTGDGFVVYLEYFQKKVTDKSFLSLDYERKRIKNKDDYIQSGGWKPFVPKKGQKKNTRNKSALINRIKGFGLPSLDQKKLAIEIGDVFNKIISPHLSAKRKQAQKWKLM